MWYSLETQGDTEGLREMIGMARQRAIWTEQEAGVERGQASRERDVEALDWSDSDSSSSDVVTVTCNNILILLFS